MGGFMGGAGSRPSRPPPPLARPGQENVWPPGTLRLLIINIDNDNGRDGTGAGHPWAGAEVEPRARLPPLKSPGPRNNNNDNKERGGGAFAWGASTFPGESCQVRRF